MNKFLAFTNLTLLFQAGQVALNFIQSPAYFLSNSALPLTSLSSGIAIACVVTLHVLDK